MAVQIFTCAQNSPEWYEARRGIPTASKFSAIMAKGEGKTRKTYMYDLLGEILTGRCAEGFSNEHTERGHELEAEALDWYMFNTDTDIKRVGFVRDDSIPAGCSPDALVGDKGGVECKTRLPRLQLLLLDDGRVPSEHVAQIQGNLWVTGCDWWDFVSYCPQLPPFKARVIRDAAYIANMAAEVTRFNAELRLLVRKYQS